MELLNRIEHIGKISERIHIKDKKVFTKCSYSEILGSCTKEKTHYRSVTLNGDEMAKYIYRSKIERFKEEYSLILDMYLHLITNILSIHEEIISDIQFVYLKKIFVDENEMVKDNPYITYMNITINIYDEKGYSKSANFLKNSAKEYIDAMTNWLMLVEKDLMSTISGRKPSACKILLGNAAVGLMAHELFGHNLETDWYRASLDELLDYMPWLTIIDDPCDKNHFLYKYDDLGNLAQKNTLIKNGKIQRYLNIDFSKGDILANARAQDYRCVPCTRMSNTYIGAGKSEESELYDELENGIVVDSLYNSVSFDKENIYLPVKEAHFNYSGYKLKNVYLRIKNRNMSSVKLGNIIEIKHMWCNKNGQEVLVGVGGPKILLEKGDILNG